MEPKLNLDEFGETITISNSDNTSATLSSGYTPDTITLSSYPWSNTSITNTSVTGGGYAYPNTVSATGGPFTINGGTGISQPWFSNSISPKIKLDGEGADIEVNGRSLIDMIKKIEERLNILTPNTKLETEWEELRALGNQYRKLEQHIKDKQATWDRLKAMTPPEVD